MYTSAGLDPSQTAYVECHGTGTQAGDWRELKAISETLGASRKVSQPIVVGSIKPNIGHLEGAAGVAGLIKGILVLEHGQIPPNINFEKPNADIDFESWKVQVPRALMNWPVPGVRRVSINCFGFGGTNAHVIMDEAPAYMTSRGLAGNHNSIDASVSSHNGCSPQVIRETCPESQIFCFSSNEKSGVLRVMNSHLGYIESQRDNTTPNLLLDYSYTLNCRRSNLEWKGAIVASSFKELASKIKTADQKHVTRSSTEKPPTICFVFSGQGSQWARMGRDLMSFASFKGSLEAASRYLQGRLDSPFILVDEIFKPDEESRIADPEISQPATTALQIALVDLMASLGILPKHVIGHSSGEIAAAYASGALQRETAWEVAFYRGLAAASVPIKAPKLKGGMMAVGMSPEEAENYLNTNRQSAQVACINSPRSVTISGQASAIHSIARDLKQKDVFHRVLPVSTAYHSKQMKMIELEYLNALRHIDVSSATAATMFSSVTGRPITGAQLKGSYWAQNMVSPVQYLAAVRRMMTLPASDRPTAIVELSPRAVLKSPTLEILNDMNVKSIPEYFSILERKSKGPDSLLGVVSELWKRGQQVNMQCIITRGVHQMQHKCLVNLPPYPWNHSKSYWHESHLGEANRFREYPRQDLIGAPTADSIPFEPRWRGFLRISENPWIQEHRVQKTIVYPAAGMVSMVLEGAKQMSKGQNNLLGYEIANMRVEKAMIVPSTAHGLEMALNIKRDIRHLCEHRLLGSHEFNIYSKQLDGPWERHAAGRLIFKYKDGDWRAAFRPLEETYSSLKRSCSQTVVPRQLYELLDTVGMNYGSLFQNIVELRKSDNSCVSKIRIPDTKAKMPAKFEYPHLIHPATLDSMFHPLFAIEPVPMVPTFIESLFVSRNLDEGVTTHFNGFSTAQRTGISDARADMMMRSNATEAYVTIKGLHLTSIKGPSSEDGGFLPNHRNLCTEVAWKEDVTFATPKDLCEHIELMAHKYPDLAVLQVGGTCSTTLALIEKLGNLGTGTPTLSRYTLADLPNNNAATSLRLIEDSPLRPFVEKAKIDGSEALAEYHYLLILDTTIDTQHLQKHLEAGGWMIKVGSKSQGSVPTSPRSFNETTSAIGLSGVMELGRKPIPIASDQTPELILLLHDTSSPEAVSFSKGLVDLPKSNNLSIDVSVITLSEAMQDMTRLAGKVVVSMLDFTKFSDDGGFVYSWDEKEFGFFHALQKSTNGMIWVTRGAHMQTRTPKTSPIIALARTLVSEDPLKIFVTLDLDHDTKLTVDYVPPMVLIVFMTTFHETDAPGPREMEFAENEGRLFIPRLTTVDALNNLVENDASSRFLARASFLSQSTESSRALRLSITNPGLAKDGMYFTEVDRPALQSSEVEVAFDKTVLSFPDLETVMGRSSECTIGMDIVGRVTRLGSGVKDIELGAEVVALVPNGSLQSHFNVDSRFVASFRPGLLPSFYVAAYYALVHVGRLGHNHKILIHAGASGFGLAAIEVCRVAGADAFVTVLGADTKNQRDILRSAGLPVERILDANSEAFVSVIKEVTEGRGVDVVYNPTQEHTAISSECVRTCGSIVQFRNRSLSQAPRMETACGTFASFDLAQLFREDGDFVAELFQNTMHFLKDRELSLTIEGAGQFDIGDLENAFKQIEKAPYHRFASIVCHNNLTLVPVLATDTTKHLRDAIDPNGTYLLAGGLGGLGRSIAELLVSNGARHLAFISRSGASSVQSSEFLESLHQQGVEARAYKADICNPAALTDVIKEQVSKEMPPIRGVFQCAAVIKDAVFENMTYEDWNTAFRPKTIGSWNIIEAMDHSGHDPFYIFLASSAGVIGNRGQANYAAGNCFEDALARSLRLRGKHAVAIDLGPVLGAGMLAEDEEILDMLRASGFYGIRHEDFLKIVKHAITMETLPGVPIPPQVTLGVGTGGLILQNQPADPYWTRTALFSYLNLVDLPPPDLTKGDANPSKDMKAILACSTDVSAATEIVCTGLMHMLAKSMNMLFEEMDAGKPPNAYGVDSLVAVGVRNWVFSNCGVQVSVFEVLSDRTVGELATMIAERGGFRDKGE